jgi:hypothetical protein
MKKSWKQRLGLMLGVAVFIGSSIDSKIAFAQPSEWSWTPTNASGVVLGQATINGAPASAADWIGAFDAIGNCAGTAPMIMNDGLAYFNLAIYGDDATTSDLDEGITAGEPFTLRIWQALTNGEATYPNDDSPTYLDGWSNTNGAPIPAYSNATAVYDFALEIQPFIVCPATTCLSGPVQTCEWGPPGGMISGPGVSGVYWGPIVAGEGLHELIYTIGDTAVSCTVQVNAAPDATISSASSICSNDAPMPLTGGSQGGTWSGDGVLGAFFDPAFINPPGDFDVTYVVDQGYGMGCVDSSTISIAVFPNPPFVEILNYIPTDGYIASGGGTDIAGYQWSTLSGGPIEGETNQVLEDPLDGLYHVVTVTNSYGCGTESEATIFYAAGISDHDASDWRVWFDAASRTIASNLPYDRVEWFDPQGRVLGKNGQNSVQQRIARVWRNDTFRVLRVQAD